IEDFTRVFYNEDVKRRLNDIFGQGILENYLSKWIDDINGNVKTDELSEYFDKGITKFKKAAVLASASVVFQQPMAIARATAYIDFKYFATNPKLIKHKETWEEVKKYAPVAIVKEIGGFDTRTGRSAVDWINGKKSIDDWLSKPAAYADEMAWCWIWEAVKKETRTKTNLKPGSEEFFKAAGERFTEVVTLTQVYDSVFAKSAFMRSQNGVVKLATSFMSEPTKLGNMLVDAGVQGKRGNKKFTVRVIRGVLLSMILTVAAKSLVYAARDDDEDESYAEKYAGAFSGSLIDELNPLSLFPILRDIGSLITGYDIERSDMAVYSDVITSFKKLLSADELGWEEIRDFGGAVAAAFGFPLKNIIRDIESVINVFNTAINGPDTTPEGLKRAIREAITGKKGSKQRQVFDAYLSGDEDEIERVLEMYDDDESEVASEITSAVKEYYISGEIDSNTATQYLVVYAGKDYDDVYWDIRKWDYISENGSEDGYSKYGSFYTAVETGVNLRATINEYISNGVNKSDLAGQITEHFKPIFKKMSKTERARLQSYLLNAYEMILTDGMTAAEKEAFRTQKKKDISKWLEE
ncbi:MAG: hypothetical protein IJM97_01390, partial [Clostridia bacterium]|nr:hypothetical protein [Clostridia bacterium]